MFKKLRDVEKSMRSIMNSIQNTNNCHSIFNNFDIDSSNAFHQCLKNNYVENVDEYMDANGNYHFQSLGNTHVNAQGLKFIRDLSLWFRIKNAIYDVLKGTLGYILGVATPLTVQAVIWIIKNSQEIQEFLLRIIQT